MKVIISGSIAFDYLMCFPGNFSDHFIPDKLDRISVSFLVDTLKKQRGGCAANIAYSLALLEERPILMGSVGKDFDDYRKALDDVGIDTSGAKTFSEAYTASFFANTDENGNQIASFYTGAMQYAKDISLKALVDTPKDTLAIISPNDPEAMKKHAQECQDLGISYIYDPSQQIIRLDGQTLVQSARGSKVLIFNEYELEMFKNKTGLKDFELLDLSEIVIITLGEKGSVIRMKEGEIIIPAANPKNILDPTGVGDAFRAGLIKGIVHQLPWDVTGRMASLAASYVLETDGPQNHRYSLKEFIDRYNDVFGKNKILKSLEA